METKNPFSRSQLNKAGEIITSSNEQSKIDASVALVDQWRSNHLPVTDELMKSLSKIFDANGITYLFSSTRIKRMISILNKLDRKEGMKLGGLNDIGGVRFVFNDIITLYGAKEILLRDVPENFELLSDGVQYDYVSRPSPIGYRSIHFVYKYRSDDLRYNGLRVELQIRTKLQHTWATTVEAAELISNSALKSGSGKTGWQDFLLMASALFSIKENCPVVEKFAGKEPSAIYKGIKLLNEKSNYTETLKVWSLSAKIIEQTRSKKDFYLLIVDYDEKKIQCIGYPSSRRDDAMDKYRELESIRLEDSPQTAVLVSALSLAQLREAYPAYFINTLAFVNEIEKACRNL